MTDAQEKLIADLRESLDETNGIEANGSCSSDYRVGFSHATHIAIEFVKAMDAPTSEPSEPPPLDHWIIETVPAVAHPKYLTPRYWDGTRWALGRKNARRYPKTVDVKTCAPEQLIPSQVRRPYESGAGARIVRYGTAFGLIGDVERIKWPDGLSSENTYAKLVKVAAPAPQSGQRISHKKLLAEIEEGQHTSDTVPPPACPRSPSGEHEGPESPIPSLLVQTIHADGHGYDCAVYVCVHCCVVFVEPDAEFQK